MKRSGRLFRRDKSQQVPLVVELVSILGSGAGGGIQRLWLANDPSKLDSLTAVGSWSPSVGAGAATQTTGTLKPAYNATGINGRPSLTFDAGDLLATANINFTGFERGIVCLVMKAAGAGLYIPLYLDEGTTAGHIGHVHRDGGGTTISGRARGASTAEVRATPFALTTAAVVTVTGDFTLTTHAAEIRVNGTQVSTSYPSDPDISAVTGLPNGPVLIGNRGAADLGLTGEIAAVMIAAWPTATAFDLAKISQAEKALGRGWGIV